MYQIFPVAMTSLNIDEFAKQIKDIVGRDIREEIKKTYLKQGDPTILASLGSSDLMQNLAHPEQGLFKHVSFTFGVIINSNDDAIILTTVFNHRYYIFRGTEASLILLTGSLCDWYNTIINACKLQVPRLVRSVGNDLFYFFSKVGLKEAFNKFTIKKLEDKTFILGVLNI